MKNPEILNVLRKIFNDPNASQRKLAGELNLSLGKLNYIVSSSIILRLPSLTI